MSGARDLVKVPRPRRRQGRPRFKPTDAQRRVVQSAVAVGMEQEQVCQLIINPTTGSPITKNTLVRYFRAELDTAMLKANLEVAGQYYRVATDPTHHSFARCAEFWLKCRAGWKHTDRHEVAIQAGVLVAPASMDPMEWVERQNQLNAERTEEPE